MTHSTKRFARCLMIALSFTPALPMAAATGNPLPAQIVKEDCELTPTGTQHLFSVDNNSLPAICGFALTPMDGSFSCPIIGTTQPANWTATLFPDGSVDWAAGAAPADCIPTATSAGGFSFLVPVFTQCCYFVDFLDASGASLYSTTHCCGFCDEPISIQGESWGGVKALYR